MRPRIFAFDITSLTRWTGSPTGMIRVEHELACCILEQDLSAVFTIYDSERGCFVRINPEYVSALISYTGLLLDRERGSLKPLRKRLFPSRRVRFLKLERARVKTHSKLRRKLYSAAQRVVCIGKRFPFATHGSDGSRLDLIRYEDAVLEELPLLSGDVILLASSDWWHKTEADISNIVNLAREGVSLAAVCYDILPLIRPEWFGQPAGSGEDIKRFRAYWHAILPSAAAIIVNSRRVREDVISYSARNSIPLRNLQVVPLGSDRPGPTRLGMRLARGLRVGRFALYVSTIEPRKNHALLLRVWSELLRKGVPQRQGFKLVLVGRRGWNVDDVLASLDGRNHLYSDTVIYFEHLNDPDLEQLYSSCAFCVYPSEYEGFGLPIVEAFARGKAVIASNGGSLNEVVGRFSPCVDPYDEEAWTKTLGQWIEHPDARVPYEERIREDASILSWREVATRMIAVARNSG